MKYTFLTATKSTVNLICYILDCYRAYIAKIVTELPSVLFMFLISLLMAKVLAKWDSSWVQFVFSFVGLCDSTIFVLFA
jgi:hypothetical protein